MIRNSFVFLERISARTEQRLWQSGFRDWDSFIDAGSVPGFSAVRKNFYSKSLHAARRRLFDYDSSFFCSFPSSESWRLYDHFRDDCRFIDVETTGHYGDVSVLGVFDGYSCHSLVKGHSLHRQNVKKVLSGAKLLVSFNGRSFDVPVLHRMFGDVLPSVPHVDLRFPLARLGHSGGLKSIEVQLGVSRTADVKCGDEAVALWHAHRAGVPGCIDALVGYNEEDVVNLKPLADLVYRRLSSGMKEKFGL